MVETFARWATRYIHFHRCRHPREMGIAEVGQFLESVHDFIRDCRAKDIRIHRAVVTDAGNLSNFPVLSQDPLFLPALCDLLTSHGIEC